jgi:hypothetical protein
VLSAAAAVTRGDGESASPEIKLRWRKPTTTQTISIVELSGADRITLGALQNPEVTFDRWTSFLAVRVLPAGQPTGEASVPLLGSYRVNGNLIEFTPRFPLEPGIRYRAEFDPLGLHAVCQAIHPDAAIARRPPRPATKLTAEIALPAKPSEPTTEVVEVYPTSRTLPENLLRFYLYFSAPMSRGEAYRRITLRDAKGKPVDAPFLELDQELWSSDGKRFTLLFDPGRIKRGLKPREELGPVVEAGKSYSLVIDSQWPDATGIPLKAAFRRSFQVGAPDDRSPDPKAWKVRSPRENTQEPLIVHFPEPLDRGLLDRLISVRRLTQGKGDVPGNAAVSDGETIWRFTPKRPWRSGDYFLVIGTDLEDIAGNSVSRPFEVDLEGPISQRVITDAIELPFRVGPGAP